MNFPSFKHCAHLVTAMLMLFPFVSVKAQHSIGFRFTPNMISQPKVINPSSAKIYGERRLAFDSGIDYTHMVSKTWGFNAGVDIGIVDWNYYLEVPKAGFGTKQGSGQIYDNSNSSNYFYNGIAFQPVYNFTLKSLNFRLSAGAGIRFYHRGRDGEVTMYAFNRSKLWDPKDPNAGPPDLSIDMPAISPQLHTDVNMAFGIERRVSDRLDLILGIRKNWGIKPISDGALMIQMYDQIYNGSFRTRSNYLGLDLQLRFATKKPKVLYTRPKPVPSDKTGYRKSVFAEAVGNGPLLSLNYDMRLKPFRNDGLGFRAGFGLGENFLGPPVEFNRYISLPLTVNYIMGKKRHGLETGIGLTPQIALADLENNPQIRPLGFLNIGYRFQPYKEGLMFRATWTPFFNSNGIEPAWLGASVGYSFR